MARIILAVSGASGVTIAHQALHWLASHGHTVELVISKAALYTASLEMGSEFARIDMWLEGVEGEVNVHRNADIGASIASGSCKVDAMVVVPCSMSTVASIGLGISDNLIRRAAAVTLKERRRLVVIPRETPLTEANLENMTRIARMGGVIMPPVPAWYLGQQTLQDVETFMVARIMDLIGVEGPAIPRWEGVTVSTSCLGGSCA